MRTRACGLLLLLALFVLGSAWSAAEKVEFVEGKNRIDVRIGGKPFTSYLHTPDPSRTMVAPGIIQTKPVLHPVLSPSGVALARGYPFENVAGEAKDHPHHQGIFFTMDDAGSTENEFWGNSQDPLPVIRHVKILQLKGGNGNGAIATVSHWIDKGGKPILEENREMVFLVLDKDTYAIDLARRVDLGILTPLAKTETDRFDRFVHGDDAANLLGTDEDGLHGNSWD